MNITIAIDSFKGSLSSMEAGTAIKTGIETVCPDAAVCVRPLADGGEGTVEALTHGMGGDLQTITVTGPLGTPVTCQYGIINNIRKNDSVRYSNIENRGETCEDAAMHSVSTDCPTAVMEMASAAGITLVPEEQRNPLKTTTYGVGEMILDAIQKGCRNFIMGIGGSATNDGGAGMLQALGYEFLDSNEQPIPLGAEGLQYLASIRMDCVIPELSQCTFQIACDVNNPLCGSNGASAIYGPQKGADADMIQKMDGWLAGYAKLSKSIFPSANADMPGAGAAGGLGFAFATFTNAALESGISIILKETRLEDYIKHADFVITGEGRLDGQTVMGKAPIGVAKLAKQYGKRVLAFSGCVTEDAVLCNQHGIDAFFPILRSVVSLEEAMEPETARRNLTDTAEQVFRLIASVI